MVGNPTTDHPERPKRKSRPSKPAIGASAKVEAVARFVVDRRKLTTEVVPADVTRAKASTWLTLLSPLTEWAGLRGDRLRHKRNLLRIYNEESVTETVEKAREKQNLPSSTVIKPIPDKFIVPFIEKVSLEEPKSALVDLWASLLASASEEFDDHYIHFVDILGRLSGKQGLLFQSIVQMAPYADEMGGLDDIDFDTADSFIRTLDKRFQAYRHPERDYPYFSPMFVLSELKEVLFGAPVVLSWCSYSVVETDDEEPLWGILFGITGELDEETEVNHEILAAIGLLKRVEVDNRETVFGKITASYFIVTQLGLSFGRAVKLRSGR